MANKTNIFDEVVRHQIQLERAKVGETKRVQATVKALDPEIRAIFNRLPENYNIRQLNIALKKIDALITSYYAKTVIPTLEQVSATVVDFEVEFAEKTIESYLLKDGEVLKKVNRAKTSREALTQTYQGHRLSTWTKQLGRTKSRSIASVARSKALNDKATPAQLASSVSGAVRKSNNAAKAVTEGYVSQSANIAHDRAYAQNEEWVEEIIWSTILDSRTTVTCGVRSNKRYDAVTKAPIDHDNEWGAGPGLIHWGCRSFPIPTRKNGKTLVNGEFVNWKDGDRTAIGAEKGYERGDNKKQDGKVYHIPTANNKLEVEVVSASTDYETWLRRQPKAFVQDTLGVTRAELFLTDNVKLDKFVVESGRELTVKQLENQLKKTG